MPRRHRRRLIVLSPRGRVGQLPELALELVAAGDHRVVGVEVVDEHQLARPIRKPQAREPVAVAARPRVTWERVVDLATQQELRDAVTAAHQIHPQVLPRSDQITKLLLLHLRHPNQPQLPRCEQPRQARRVALIGLDLRRSRS